MAKETILSISLKEYKAEIEDLKGSLLGLDSSSKAYQSTLDKVRSMQDKLNSVLKDCKGSTQAAAGSYNALQQEMTALRKEWAATSNEIERKALGEKILSINNQLKQMDATIGNYQRNVGDYAGQLASHFGSVGGTIASSINQFNSLTNTIKGFGNALAPLGTAFQAFGQKIQNSNGYVMAIGLALTAVIGIFKTFSNAIKGNEETSKKWEVAMSAFEPILDGIKNAIGYVADALVDVIGWVTDKLPAFVGFLGKYYKWMINAIATIVDVWLFIPSKLSPVFEWVYTAFGKLVGGIVEQGAKLADAFGFDEFATKMKGFADTCRNAGKVFGQGLANIAKNGGDYVRSFASGVDNYLSNMSKAMVERKKFTKEKQDLDKKERQLEIDQVKFEQEQDALRAKIRATSDAKEKARLKQQFIDRQEANTKMRVELANQAVKLKTLENSFSPSSREDNLALESLQKRAAEVSREGNRMVAKFEADLENGGDKLSESAKKQVEKIAEKAKKEQEKAAKEYSDNVKKTIERIKTEQEEASNTLSQQKSVAAIGNDTGELTTTQTKAFMQQEYALREKGYNELLALYDKYAADEKLSEDERFKYKSLAIEVETNKLVDQVKTQQEIRKQDIAEVNTYYAQLGEAASQAQDTAAAEILEKNTQTYKALAEQYVQGQITEEEFTTKTLDLKRQTEEEQYQLSLDGQQKELELMRQKYEQLKGITSEQSPEMLDLAQTIADKEIEIREYELGREKEINEQRVEDFKKAQDKELKASQDHAKKVKATYTALSRTMGSLMSSIADYMQDEIDAKVESGEMSEEEAAKEFERVKALKIVTATISTIQGAIEAYTQAQSLGPIAGPIVGGINAAAVTAMGIMQIAQIRKQQYSSNSSNAGTSLSTPTIATASTADVAVQPLLDENQDADKMSTIKSGNDSDNKDTRVYIVESDIQDSNNRVSVRENNTTW